MKRVLFCLVTAAFLSTGCAHVISKESIEHADRDISFAQLRENPDAYKGIMVILGGVIVNTVNKDDGSLLEAYQTRTSRIGEPVELDVSQGRFLIYYKGFLDPEIFQKGRKISVAGWVEGVKFQKLGDFEYRYPLLEVGEIYLWEEITASRYEPYPWHFRDYPHPYFLPYYHYPYYPRW